MHVHEYEKTWIMMFVVGLGAFLAALVAGAIIFGVRVPSAAGFINPNQLQDTEFANPGLRDMGNNEYTLTLLARMWSYQPAEVRVPVGAKLTIRATSADITHGFIIEKHNVNFELIPGHIAAATVTFNEPGTYHYMCHEYCGRGHQLMHGQIIVEEVANDTTGEG